MRVRRRGGGVALMADKHRRSWRNLAVSSGARQVGRSAALRRSPLRNDA